MVNIFLAIRRCFRARKKIGRLIDGGISSIKNVQNQVQELAVFVEVQGLGMMQFCETARKITEIGDDLLRIKARLEGIGRIHKFFTATESVTALESICSKLSLMEMEMRLLIPAVQSNTKGSIVLDVLAPLLQVAKAAHPDHEELEDKQLLLKNARQAFGSTVLSSRMNRLVTGTASHASTFNLITGKMYYLGLNAEVDYSRSAFHFENAIQGGNTEAYLCLGKQYMAGLGKPEDSKKAFVLYMEGATKRDPGCMYEVGQCLERGIGVKKDEKRCLDYYMRSAEAGYAKSFESAGACLYYGRGTTVDLAEAARLYKRGAEAGEDEALVHYAICLLHGRGVEMNMKCSVALLKIAASAGSADALNLLGNCYATGFGVEANPKTAYDYYIEAANANNLEALASVGKCLLLGFGVRRNIKIALGLIRFAAKKGNAYVLSLLAGIYEYGDVVITDERKALKLYHRATEIGHTRSHINIAYMYQRGEGTEVNISKAIYHFEISARYSHWGGHWGLAKLLEREGNFRNIDRSIYHYRRAADLGRREASDIVAMLFVRSTAPRKMSFTVDEQVCKFIEKMLALYSQRKNRTQHILAPQDSPSEFSWDDRFPDLIDIFQQSKSVSRDPTKSVNQSSTLDVSIARSSFEKRSDAAPSHTVGIGSGVFENSTGFPVLHGDDNCTGSVQLSETVTKSTISYAGEASEQSHRLYAETPSIGASIKRRFVNANSRLRQKLPGGSRRTGVEDIMKWKDMELTGKAINELSPTELASALCAYIVRFDSGMVKEYCEMKGNILKYLRANLISGTVLVNGDKEVARKRMDEMIDVLCENSPAPAAAVRDSLEVLLSSFMGSIRGTVA